MSDAVAVKHIKAYVQENNIIRLGNGKKEGFFLGRLIDDITYDQLEEINDVQDSVKILTTAIKNDSDLKQGYIANIAMVFVDECNGSPGFENVPYDMLHQAANKAAERFLDSWCYGV